MATENYPSEILPAPLISAYGLQDADLMARTVMDNGFTVVRNRFTRVPMKIDIQINLIQSSLALFEYWYSTLLSNGATWFNMNLAVGGGPAVAHECRFIGPTKQTLTGQRWLVEGTLEAIQRIQNGPNYDAVLIGLYGSLGGMQGLDTVSDILDQFDYDMNTTLPSILYNPV